MATMISRAPTADKSEKNYVPCRPHNPNNCIYIIFNAQMKYTFNHICITSFSNTKLILNQKYLTVELLTELTDFMRFNKKSSETG